MKKITRIIISMTIMVFIVLGCKKQDVKPIPDHSLSLLPLEKAIKVMAHYLKAQMQYEAKNGLVVIVPFFDEHSGEVPKVSERIEQMIISEMGPTFNAQRISVENVSKASFLLHGFIGGEKGNKSDQQVTKSTDNYFVVASILDLKTSKIIAKFRMPFLEQHMDYSSVSIDKDCPIHVISQELEQRKRAVSTMTGHHVPQNYVDSIQAEAYLASAMKYYGEQKFQDAYRLLNSLRTIPEILKARIYAARYTTAFKLGDYENAKKHFLNLITTNIRKSGEINLKFLFRVDSIKFTMNKHYNIWLEQLGNYFTQHQTCIEIQGHCSKTGPRIYNLDLSKARAEHVRKILSKYYPEIRNRSVIKGFGYDQCEVCTETDNPQNQKDRRVVLKIIDCNNIE